MLITSNAKAAQSKDAGDDHVSPAPLGNLCRQNIRFLPPKHPFPILIVIVTATDATDQPQSRGCMGLPQFVQQFVQLAAFVMR